MPSKRVEACVHFDVFALLETPPEASELISGFEFAMQCLDGRLALTSVLVVRMWRSSPWWWNCLLSLGFILVHMCPTPVGFLVPFPSLDVTCISYTMTQAVGSEYALTHAAIYYVLVSCAYVPGVRACLLGPLCMCECELTNH